MCSEEHEYEHKRTRGQSKPEGAEQAFLGMLNKLATTHLVNLNLYSGSEEDAVTPQPCRYR
jgi:hypothetical protein